GALRVCANAAAVGDAVAQLLADEGERIAMTRAGRDLLDGGRGALARTLDLLRPALPSIAGG
ncbi:MAG: hypothetical protein NDI66_07890, partial [Pseudomonas sp.]|nr:hypothetical protein [Pseudomonas sp.]